MKVFKFGGASVKDANAVKNVGSILKKYQNEKLLIVISAMGKTTNGLERMLGAWFDGKGDLAANELAETSMKYALKTEKKHKILYERAKAALQNKQLQSLSMQYYVCPTCGNTYDTNAPKRCRISMTNSDKFISINAI